MSTKRQKCGRCQKNLALDSFSPSKRGRPGKWCRSCRRAYRLLKKGTKKSAPAKARKTGDVYKKSHHKPPKVGKVLKAALSAVPALS